MANAARQRRRHRPEPLTLARAAKARCRRRPTWELALPSAPAVPRPSFPGHRPKTHHLRKSPSCTQARFPKPQHTPSPSLPPPPPPRRSENAIQRRRCRQRRRGAARRGRRMHGIAAARCRQAHVWIFCSSSLCAAACLWIVCSSPPAQPTCMNFLQTERMSVESVAENIITCFSCGVPLKISCTSLRMSALRAACGALACGRPACAGRYRDLAAHGPSGGGGA